MKFINIKLYGGKLKEQNTPRKNGKSQKVNKLFFIIFFNLFYENILKF